MSHRKQFSVITGKAISEILSNSHKRILEIVKDTYLLHSRRETINPDSYFLRFEKNPSARIIALPAAVLGDDSLAGIKWIASFPENTKVNLQRASATMILNDYETGYPIACLEASQISAARTSASAVLAAEVLSKNKKVKSIGIVGAGYISKNIVDYFVKSGWNADSIGVFDLNSEYSNNLSKYIEREYQIESNSSCSLEELISKSEVVVLATTAAVPYISDSSLFFPGQVVLNISLRDIEPEIILSSTNIVDDVEHCMKANTSTHLTEQLVGNRNFVDGTLADVISGLVKLDANRPIIFSPFGLGVLDIAVARFLYRRAISEEIATSIPEFFPDINRW